MNPLSHSSRPHDGSPSTSKKDVSEPSPGAAWQGKPLTLEQSHELVTNANNDLTPADRAAIANEAIAHMKQKAEEAAALPPPGLPAAPAMPAAGPRLWGDLAAIAGGAVAGSFVTGIGVLVGTQGHPELLPVVAGAVIPSGAVIGAAIAELTYRGYFC